ncbi:hypothetical protein F5888DRAFT_1803273 [Russula emetica]|nr:hypothetical protein F5888DRAFT_1803273 [Russula emetica]
MVRLSPSSNSSFPTADPRRQKDDDDDDDDNNNDDDQHDRSMTSPVNESVAPTTSTPRSPSPSVQPRANTPPTSSEGYPSWLPKRPPLPAPFSTLHSLSTAMMFGSSGVQVPPSTQRGSSQLQRRPSTTAPCAFLRRAQTTPRSVRIVSIQDSNAVIPPRVQVVARAMREPTTRTPDARLRAAIATPPKFRSPGMHLELLRDLSCKTRIHFYLFPILVLAHVPLETFLDFNAIYILIELQSSRIWTHLEFPALVVTGSWVPLHTLRAGSSGFGVFLRYEVFYSYCRSWCFCRPLILPICLSSPTFNFVAMSSFDHSYFLQHIRSSAFPYVDSSANLPTVVTLLPRAGLALALLLSFFSPEILPGGLSLSDVDQSIARRDGTFLDKNAGALSAYAKGILIANAAPRRPPAQLARSLDIQRVWLCGALWASLTLGGGRSCRATSIRSETSESGMIAAMGASGADALPWRWKECTLLRVYDEYELCLTFRTPRSEKSAVRPSEGGFEGIENVFAAVGLSGAATTAGSERIVGACSRETCSRGPPSRRSSTASEHRNGREVITPPPDALAHEKSMAEDDKNAPPKKLPYPFSGFGPRDSSEQEQIPFLPSPTVPEESAISHDEEEEEVEVEEDIEVEVDDESEEEEEEEEINPRSSEEPSLFSGLRGGSMSSTGSSTGSPPFAFSRASATPQSKSPSTRESHETRSKGNVETTNTSSSFSGGSPTSAVSPTSSVPSPQDVRGMPMPPRHPAAGGGRQRPSTAPSPVSPTPAGLTATRPRQTFEGHRRQLRQSIGSEVLQESDREDDRASRSGQPCPDGSPEAREREDSVGLLSPPSSQPSPRASLLGSRNGSSTSLARISGALRSRSRNISSGSGSGSGSGGSSRHNSHVSVSSASLALGRARAHSLIQNIGGASRSSIELVLGRMPQPSSPPATGAVRLGDTSDVDGSEGALSNPESHTFGLPVVGGAGSLLPRRAGFRAHTLEGDPGRSSVSVSSSSSAAAASVAVAVARARSARGQVASPEPRRSSSRARSSTSLSSERERQGTQLQSSHSFGSQGSRQQQQQEEEIPPSPSILSQSVQSEDTTSGSTTTRMVTLAQVMSEAPSQAQTRVHTPAGVPIPSSPSPPPQSSPHLPGDLSTAPTIVSRTTDSGADGRTPEMWNEGAGDYAPPPTRGFMP